MNSIKAELTTTEYIDGEHLMIFIDEKRLDKWICEKLNNEYYLNLIPTWLGWLLNSKEQEYVWAKTQSCRDNTEVIPMLICPDDLDFSCTVIVCEVKYTDTSVQWCRIGLDITGLPNYIGEEIEWFENIPIFEFSKQEYEACIDKFISNHDSYYL